MTKLDQFLNKMTKIDRFLERTKSYQSCPYPMTFECTTDSEFWAHLCVSTYYISKKPVYRCSNKQIDIYSRICPGT